MTTVTELALPSENLALSRTLEALPELEVRVKSVVTEGSSQAMPLVWISGEPKADLEEALAEDSSVNQFNCLLADTAAEEWLYRIEYDSGVEEMCSAIFANDGTILDAQCAANYWTFRLLFPERDGLSEAVSELEDQGIDIDIRQMVEAGRNADLEATTALTESQEEAITEAYKQGYYDVPRQIALEELADELGISHQALSERLRRANKVLANEQVGEPRQDGLAH